MTPAIARELARMAENRGTGAFARQRMEALRLAAIPIAWARRLLLVRPSQVEPDLRAFDVPLGSATFALVVLETPAPAVAQGVA